MNFQRQVPQLLHDEHRASIDLMNRLEQVAARGPVGDLAALAGAVARQLEHEVQRHFAFEEQQLFVRMAEAGDGDLAELLAEEHDSLRAVAAELLPLARALADGTLPATELPGYRRLALELVERMVAHIQKETMGLLPLLDDLLDEAADRELAFAYAQS